MDKNMEEMQEEVFNELMTMPNWKFRLLMFKSRYGEFRGTYLYAVDSDWKPELDVVVFHWCKWQLKRVLWLLQGRYSRMRGKYQYGKRRARK